MFFFSGIEMDFKHSTWNFEWFLHMLLKFEIIWTRIGQVIRLSIFVKQPVNHLGFEKKTVPDSDSKLSEISDWEIDLDLDEYSWSIFSFLPLLVYLMPKSVFFFLRSYGFK